MAPRRKAPRIDAPTTIEQATAMIAKYLDMSAMVEQTRAEADAAIRAIEEARDLAIAPTELAIRDMFAQLRTWWAVARDDMTLGNRRSIDLAGATIGERITPPALKLPKGWRVEDAVNFLDSLKTMWPIAGDFLRVRTDIEKPALIKLLSNSTSPSPMRDRILEEGFTTQQRDEFFIARAAREPADPVVEVLS